MARPRTDQENEGQRNKGQRNKETKGLFSLHVRNKTVVNKAKPVHHRRHGKKPPAPDLSGLTHDEKDILVLTLLARLDALESKVHKDSHNSSKPPSSDGLTKKTRSLRESSGKPAGGQVGHKGTTLKQAAQPIQTVEHPLPGQCDRCRNWLPLNEARVAERRQIFDVPATAFDVVEHQTFEVTCSCGQVHASAFPTDVSDAVQYGPNVRALAVHLTQGQMLPTRAPPN